MNQVDKEACEKKLRAAERKRVHSKAYATTRKDALLDGADDVALVSFCCPMV